MGIVNDISLGCGTTPPPLGRPARGWYVDIKKAELKFLDEKLHPPQEASVAATEPSETEIGKAWRELYMEFIWVSEPKGAKMASICLFLLNLGPWPKMLYNIIIIWFMYPEYPKTSHRLLFDLFAFEKLPHPPWRGSRFLRPPKLSGISGICGCMVVSDKCPNCENKCISESMFSLNDIWVQSMLNKRWICFYHLLSFKKDTLKSPVPQGHLTLSGLIASRCSSGGRPVQISFLSTEDLSFAWAYSNCSQLPCAATWYLKKCSGLSSLNGNA